MLTRRLPSTASEPMSIMYQITHERFPELAKVLPSIAVSDPRPWLLWLSHDTDPRVRKATVAILATNPDPILQDRLRELELKETDESVLRVVKQALEQRRRRP